MSMIMDWPFSKLRSLALLNPSWYVDGKKLMTLGIEPKVASMICGFRPLSHTRQRTLTYFIKGSINVQLTYCLTGLDATKQVYLLLIQHKQSSLIKTNKAARRTVKLTLAR